MSQFNKYIKIAQEMINEGKDKKGGKNKSEMTSEEIEKISKRIQKKLSEIKNKLGVFYDENEDYFYLDLIDENNEKQLDELVEGYEIVIEDIIKLKTLHIENSILYFGHKKNKRDEDVKVLINLNPRDSVDKFNDINLSNNLKNILK